MLHFNHFRFKSLQEENAQLRQQRTLPVCVEIDDSQLVQELDFKNKQIDITHSQKYADDLDEEKRRADIFTRETQQLQQQLQYGNQPPPVPSQGPVNMVIICFDDL